MIFFPYIFFKSIRSLSNNCVFFEGAPGKKMRMNEIKHISKEDMIGNLSRRPQAKVQRPFPRRCHTHVRPGDKNPKPNNRENPPAQSADLPARTRRRDQTSSALYSVFFVFFFFYGQRSGPTVDAWKIYWRDA